MINGIDFVCLPIQDMARARAFYEEKMELKASSVYGESFVEYDLGGAILALGDVKAMGMEFAPVKTGSIALHVDDVQATLDKLRAKGVQLPAEANKTSVCYMAMFEDSEGNALILHNRFAPEH